MRRYLLSPVVGSGTRADPYRAKVRDLLAGQNAGVVSLIPTGPDGKPIARWCLCLVDAPNLTAVLADAAVGALPDFPLDVKVNAMALQTRLALTAVLAAFQVDTGIVVRADAFRNVVRAIGQALDPSFDENNFDPTG
jgi:hypothetical protein